MPAEVWLWLLYHNHCGIKITGSTYTRFVAAGMWSNFVVDYLLVDAGMGGSGNYHADSSHVGWPDIFRTMLHTHHALMGEQVDLTGAAICGLSATSTGALRARAVRACSPPAACAASWTCSRCSSPGPTACSRAASARPRRSAARSAATATSTARAAASRPSRSSWCRTTRRLMAQRVRNWTALNIGQAGGAGRRAQPRERGAGRGRRWADRGLIDDIRKLRGRTDLLEMPDWEVAAEGADGRGRPPTGRRRRTAPTGGSLSCGAARPKGLGRSSDCWLPRPSLTLK